MMNIAEVECKNCKLRGTTDCPMLTVEHSSYVPHLIYEDETRDDGTCEKGEPK